MARNFRALVAAGLLALFTTGAAAQSGCGGQGAAGAVCGNQAASTGLPSLGTVTGLLDRAMGSAQGRVLQRGAGGWAASPNPSLGVNGSVGGAITLNGSSSGSVTLRVPAAAGGAIFQFPSTNGTAGFVLITDGSGNTSWANNTAGGTVQSVGLSMPGIFSVSGSPVTLTGTLTATLATQSANMVWAGPTTGAAAAPTFRALVGADLPNPSASALGGIQSFAAVSSQWIRQISTGGVPTASQPAFTDISGTLAAAQCPNPGASSLGCIQSLAAVPSRWINAISTLGVPSATQPNFTDLLGSASLSQLPSISNQSVLGNTSGGTAVPSALTATQVLDFVGSTQGQILYRNASAWVALSPGTSGQVLTTGGAAANPAWATVSGTGTVTNVATGSGLTGGPITTTGTVQLATIANNTVLANVSGGALAPSPTTPTLILDIIGSTQGNVLYRAAGNWTVLPPGTNGQVLTMGASTPAWASSGSVTNVTIAAGAGLSTSGTCNISTTGTCTLSYVGDPAFGSWKLLNTLTASGSATLSDATNITSTYKDYQIVLTNVLPATNGVDCLIQVQTGGVFQTSTYASVVTRSNGSSNATASLTNGIPCSGSGGQIANAGTGVSGTVTLLGPVSATGGNSYKVGNIQTTYTNGGAQTEMATAGGFYNSTVAVTGVRVIMTSGNITSGTMKIYGRN